MHYYKVNLSENLAILSGENIFLRTLLSDNVAYGFKSLEIALFSINSDHVKKPLL